MRDYRMKGKCVDLMNVLKEKPYSQMVNVKSVQIILEHKDFSDVELIIVINIKQYKLMEHAKTVSLIKRPQKMVENAFIDAL